ncbi:MAG: flagellar hook-basal body protein [Lachnospiraceae bacterium]|nr:flagellar hook-basal body protein [Lachnospiraceae bacterium]
MAVRSLWTGASGMIAQQTNVDTIANNLANVSTVGYKMQANQFKSLLYQTLQTETTSANNETKPTTAQVGLGVRSAAIQNIFTQGSMLDSESDTDFAIEGEGFFAVRDSSGDINYTRNGNFYWAMNTAGGVSLTNSDGYMVLNTAGNVISLANTYETSKITVGSDGTLYYPDAKNVPQSMNITIGLWQFRNPSGLERVGNTLYQQTAASGAAINEATNNQVTKSRVNQGYLEGSNVEVANEMVNLITAQRAYELNSKAITTSDEMMQQANNLRS